MFLALAPPLDSWDLDTEVLLLGPWCASYDERRDLSSVRWRLLPSPWEDRTRYHAASASADEATGRLLGHLATHLNAVHRVERSLAYWRIVIGPWLLHFVHAVCDRYAHLQDAIVSVPHVRTAVLAEESFRTGRTTFEAFRWLGTDHHYNWQIFSELLPLIDDSVPRRTVVNQPPATGRGGRTAPAAYLAARLAGAINWTGRALLTDLSASRSTRAWIAVRSTFRVLPFHVSDELRSRTFEPAWDTRRLALGDLPACDPFEQACVKLLPRHFPTIYLEGFHHALETVSRRYPRPPSVLASETGWYVNDTFKYLAAEAHERGARLVTVQHGGGYGISRALPQEALERSIGNPYFVWGWADRQPLLENLPHPLVSRPRRRPRSSSLPRILFAPQSAQPYQQRLDSTPVGAQWEQQWEWQARFVGALPDHLRRRVMLRPPPADFGQGLRQRLCDRYPEIAIDRSHAFHRSAVQSRLTVIEKLGTGLLETLAMDTPTVLFWDPRLWEVREQAVPYFEALRGAGILWDCPDDAAAHIATVYEDVESWWRGSPVQAARRGLVDRFALGRRDWARCWVDVLKRQVARASVAQAVRGTMRHGDA